MRPDRIVVGEVRGAELVDLLIALNTGHEGGCGTVHANAAETVPARLEALAALGGLGREAAHSQIAAAVQAVVHVARDGVRRRVAGVAVLARGTDGFVVKLTDTGAAFVFFGSAAGLADTASWTASSDRASSYFGTSAKWRDIYNANRDILKSESETLHVGMELRIP